MEDDEVCVVSSDATVVTSSSILSASSSSSSDPIAATRLKDFFLDLPPLPRKVVILVTVVFSPNAVFFFSSSHVLGGPFNGCSHVNRPKKFAAPKNISFVSAVADKPQSFTSDSNSTAF